ncbi:outer membrane beta-barrel protein [Devosia neptuniae]|jgi:outer membrane immunogenic protein|uniref:Outer membrane beta-barrel protein n=1 Tax=Devosia neptuniae TaxID=191302 RepID=A0ABY6CAZ9_9HYPH|nr:outer membrane beta-barrel protein [Devosia neptuniae]UXN69406.1 outer membrane beta-barrel protein [Devosia neptuniae]
MKLFNAFAIAALTATLSTGPAAAADMITVPTSTPVEMPVAESAGFDWSGFYAGVYGVAQHGEDSGTQYGLGVQAGVNAQFDYYLLGAEVAVHGLAGNDGAGETSYGQILGRAGLAVTDDVAVYAAGGYGLDLGAPEEDDMLFGAGVEMAITGNVSVEAQYLRSFPLSGDNAKNQFTVGANYHF